MTMYRLSRSIKLGEAVKFMGRTEIVVEIRRNGVSLQEAEFEDDAVRCSIDGGLTGIITFARTLEHAE